MSGWSRVKCGYCLSDSGEPFTYIIPDTNGSHYLWPVWPTRAVIAVTLAGMLVILASGCATCPPCVPTTEVVDNPLPVYYCPAPPEVAPVALPPWPVLPPDATDAQVKAWYADVVAVVHAREAAWQSKLDEVTAMVDAYRNTP